MKECMYELIENMDDELEDAEKYAELSIKYKESSPEMCRLYKSLSEEELGHFNKLKTTAYEKAKSEDGEKKLWEYEMSRMHKEFSTIKTILDMN